MSDPHETHPPETRSHETQSHETSNPKRDPDPGSNTVKDPDDWTTGDEPMTGAQASYLKTLTEEAKDEAGYEEGLSKAEASKRIDALKKSLGR